MDKIAIISDIHGNLEALQTVFKDIKKRKIDKIICLGDIVGKGTHQEECVNLIKENCYQVIRGNNEDFYAQEWDINEAELIEQKRYHWIRNKLSKESLNYLKSLPYCYEIYLSGRLVRFFHAHPEKNYNFIGNIDNLDRLYELFLPSDNTITNQKADIVIYGHIHTQFMQKIYNRVILNTGSVGNAFDVFRNPLKDGNVKNTTLCNYLIIKGNLNSLNIEDEISYEFVNLSYDLEKELQCNIDNIEYESYKREILNGIYRDTKKLSKSFEIRGIDKDKI